MQTFRIGDLGIASLPFEIFAEIGFEIQERSPFKETIIIELANGGLGYLPSPRQHELGGYETWLTVNSVEKTASPKLPKFLAAFPWRTAHRCIGAIQLRSASTIFQFQSGATQRPWARAKSRYSGRAA